MKRPTVATWGVIVGGGALVLTVAAAGESLIAPAAAAVIAIGGAMATATFSARRHGRLSGAACAMLAAFGGLVVTAGSVLALAEGGGETAPLLGTLGLVILLLASYEHSDPRLATLAGDVRVLFVGAAVGFGGLAVAGLLGGLPVTAAAAADVELTGMTAFVVQQLGIGLGFVVATDRGLAYVDVRRPGGRDLGMTVLGIGIILGLAVLISAIYAVLGIESAMHALERRGRREGAELLLVAMVFAFVSQGLGEELLFRNGVQKYFTEHFSAAIAILASSLLFAAGHAPAYAALEPAHTLGSLVIVFLLSLVLAVIYERTGNVLVPVVIHGTYNAVVYLVIYLRIVGTL